MRDTQRAMPVLRLLARLRWQRDPTAWTVRCRDGNGERAVLRIQLAETGIRVAASSAGPWTLSPLAAERLRGAVRDALLEFDRVAGGAHDPQLHPRHTNPATLAGLAGPRDQHTTSGELARTLRPATSRSIR
ncbi:hypothetical protein [Haloechinothrix salitolerans]|uniref:DUF1508 domain-containing protein n=1 Tax=Haloechinothrix salitolerans TaxID=926830 RepID=A0ABW2BX11_9PSEU